MSKLNEDDKKFIKSPILRNSMLYWACTFKISDRDNDKGKETDKEDDGSADFGDLDRINRILKLECIWPELPLLPMKMQNAFHACAGNNHHLILETLFDYLNNKNVSSTRRKARTSSKKSSIGVIESLFKIPPAHNEGSNDGRDDGKNDGSNRSNLLDNQKNENSLTQRIPINNDIIIKNQFSISIHDIKKYHNSFISYLKFMNNWMLLIQTNQTRKKQWEVKNSHGNTPLHIASLEGFEACARILLEQGNLYISHMSINK